MSRYDLSGNATASQATHINYVLLADFDFASGHIRFCTATRTLNFGGYTWLTVGQFAGVSGVKESIDLASDKITYTVNVPDSSMMSVLLTEDYHGRDATLYLGFMDSNFNLINDPQIIREDHMDQMSLSADNGSLSIYLSCENRLALWEKTSGYLYTHEYQRLIDPTDDFFKLVPTLDGRVVKWNETEVKTGYQNRNPA